MKKHKILLVFISVILLVGCNVNKISDSEIDEKENLIKELAESNKQREKLEDDYSELENKLNEANEKIIELEAQLQNDSHIEETVSEITEDEARELVYKYIRENHDPDNIARGYQYCVHKDNDVFIVEKFSPEPGTPDRSAMLLEQYELDIETGQITETAQDAPGQKRNCMNGTDI